MLLFLIACGPDLPAGWEDAQPVTELVQTECGDSPYEPFTSTVSADLAADPLSIQVTHAHFRCAQDVEGFYRQQGDVLDVLVQPIDMNPIAIAACDCLYDLDITIDTDPVGSVTVYRRWDNENSENDPVEIGRAP